MQIYQKALGLIEADQAIAIGIVVEATGSTPQKPGSKAILDSSGQQWGTLGGGLVEAEGLARMKQAQAEGVAQLFEFRLDEAYSRCAGPICGGVMRLFADPNPARNASAYRMMLDAGSARERGVLATIIQGDVSRLGEAKWIRAGVDTGNSIGLDADAITRCLDIGQACVSVSADGGEVFLEPIAFMPRLLIVGGGHVGQAIAVQGVQLGFDVSVIDDREEYARPELFPPGVRAVAGNIGEFVDAFPKDDDTYIVLVSKGHRPDAEALESCIHSDARYIGMIGSKRKIRLLRKHFIADGLASEETFDRIEAPIGYEIGAVTVPEIAVSIAAQLIAARRMPSAVRDVTAMGLTRPSAPATSPK